MKARRILICGAAPVLKIHMGERSLDFDYIVAVDGGYDTLLGFGLVPDIYIGDLDSVKNEVVCKKEISSKDKDESDLGLALKYIFSKFSKIEDIIVLGVISQIRLDHTLSNIFTLLEYDNNFEILCDSLRILVLNSIGKYDFNVATGDRISLFTFCNGKIEARGLKFQLPEVFKTHSHGISNIAISNKVSVDIKSGKFLIMLFKGNQN